MSVQQSYSINPPVGFPGQIAEPNSPTRVERGTLQVPASATRANPRPGDHLYYNNTQNAWQVPTSAATQLQVGGILGYRADDVAASNDFVQYSDGDEVEVITMGVVWVVAGGASERGDIVVMQTDDWQYDAVTRVTAVTDIQEMPTVNYQRGAVASGDIFKVAIGYGRAI